MKRFGIVLLLLGCLRVLAAEVIPPAPATYFNDYARVVPSATAQQLNQKLEDFERESSDQILVAVFPKMETDSSIEDYTVRVARAWRAGQEKKNNGAILFVFIQEHKMFIQVGYGLEAVLPDAICKRIIEDEIVPSFKNGDYAAGLTAGVNGMLAAVQGEYQGTGSTVAERHQKSGRIAPFLIFGIVALLYLIAAARRRGGYRSGGWIMSGGGWGGGGWGGGGGFSGGGGGGFSGGGGSFGGGGAGGSW